jgi:hypothetical protein
MAPESRMARTVIGRKRPRFALHFLFLCAFLYCGNPVGLCGQNNSSETPQATVLRGTVVNSVTHDPIGRALVFSPDNRFAAMTDDRGQFEFKLPAPPEVAPEGAAVFSSGRRFRGGTPDWPTFLKARKPGFLADSDENGGQGVMVNPEQPSMSIVLEPEALIIGHVHLPSSDYLSRIQVELYRRDVRQGHEHWSNAGTTTSRADGSFRFASLAAGWYKLITRELLDRDPETLDPQGQLLGYPPVYYPSAADFASAEGIRLIAGATFQADVSPVRREYFPVKVGVARAEGGMQIEVWPVGHPGPGYALGYNATDGVLQGSLPGGVYTISAASYGPTRMSGVLNLTVNGGTATGSTLLLVPNPSVTATVREEFQDPQVLEQVRNLEQQEGNRARRPNYLNINLIPTEDFNSGQNATLRQPNGPEDGPLAADGVRPGVYRVEANSNLGYIAAMNSGGTDLLHKPLVVSAGAAPPPIEITVRDDGAQVEGTVDDPTPNGGDKAVIERRGYNQSMVYFLPLPDSGGQFRTSWFYGDGHFQMAQLPPGAYGVLAFEHPQPEIEYAAESVLKQYEDQVQVIQVSAGQKQHLRLPLIHGSK